MPVRLVYCSDLGSNKSADSMSNPFWAFSLATYQKEGVASTCLVLQDRFGLDVNLLLYAAWLAHHDLRLEQQHLRELDALLADWRLQVLQPLRALRRQLAGYAAATGVHEELKVLELRAEQEQQEMMYSFHQRATGFADAVRPLQENLVQVAHLVSPHEESWGGDIEHLAALIAL